MDITRGDIHFFMRFSQLESFKAQHGHLQLENMALVNRDLAGWAKQLKKQKESLENWKLEFLENVDFEWEAV